MACSSGSKSQQTNIVQNKNAGLYVTFVVVTESLATMFKPFVMQIAGFWKYGLKTLHRHLISFPLFGLIFMQN